MKRSIPRYDRYSIDEQGRSYVHLQIGVQILEGLVDVPQNFHVLLHVLDHGPDGFLQLSSTFDSRALTLSRISGKLSSSSFVGISSNIYHGSPVVAGKNTHQ